MCKVCLEESLLEIWSAARAGRGSAREEGLFVNLVFCLMVPEGPLLELSDDEER